MEKNGLNKKLYLRRLELDYSEKEASIRLDISPRHLYLIENGYIDVDEKLQGKFIRKYKLEPDFFSNDENLGYPTPLENVEVEPSKKLLKALCSTWTKVITGLLALIFIVMGSIGLNNVSCAKSRVPEMFSHNITVVRNIVQAKGIEYNYIHSTIAKTRMDNYCGLHIGDETHTEQDKNAFHYCSLNFFNKLENIDYTFIQANGYYSAVELDIPFFDEDDDEYVTISFETKYADTFTRTHMHIYDEGDLLGLAAVAHVSADISFATNEVHVNLMESRDAFGNLYHISPSEATYQYVLNAFKKLYTPYLEKTLNLFDAYYPTLGMSYATFQDEMVRGEKAVDDYYIRNNTFLITGFCVGILALAIFGLSFVSSYSLDEKLFIPVSEDMDFNVMSDDRRKDVIPIKRKPLPRNWKIPPIIPEAILRIMIIVTMVISGIGLYQVFHCITEIDIQGTINSLAFKKEVGTYATLALLLSFFIKLDIRSKIKRSFLLNYFLFFAGLVYYFLMVAATTSLGNETGFVATIINNLLVTYLPGNLIWSILAFNLLVSSLFSTPEFEKPTKGKYIAYRLTCLIPIAYMAASVVVQIGQKVGDWNLPFSVTALFFTKALMITVFSILFCFAIFFYRRFIYKKYGKENAEIYQNGRRYFFTKNLITALIVVIIVIADMSIAKAWPNDPLKFGSSYVLLYGLPFILLYTPHMGKRNNWWDILYNLLYVGATILGVVLIIASVSTYLMSL